jgi:hypothetical protein
VIRSVGTMPDANNSPVHEAGTDEQCEVGETIAIRHSSGDVLEPERFALAASEELSVP